MDQRGAALSDLRQIIDFRHDLSGRREPTSTLPVHVVAIDGARLLAASDITDLLSRGPSVGVFGTRLLPPAVNSPTVPSMPVIVAS